MAQWHRWKEEELEIIRRDYKHTRESKQELARRISEMFGEEVSQHAVAGQLSKMGICKNGRRPWTPEEEEKLKEIMYQYSPGHVAKLMRRSVNSVVVKSKRLKISRRVRDGWFTKREVCEMFGVDHKWLQARIDSDALKATYHYATKPSKLGGSAWHITEKAVKDFLQHYPGELAGRNVDIIMLVDILAGVK